MADGSWDGEIPESRTGMPVWGKVLIGCGVAMLLALGACVAGTWEDDRMVDLRVE